MATRANLASSSALAASSSSTIPAQRSTSAFERYIHRLLSGGYVVKLNYPSGFSSFLYFSEGMCYGVIAFNRSFQTISDITVYRGILMGIETSYSGGIDEIINSNGFEIMTRYQHDHILNSIMILSLSTLINKYNILYEIGYGTYGRVYLAKSSNPASNVIYTIKISNPGITFNGMEINILKSDTLRIRHPNMYIHYIESGTSTWGNYNYQLLVTEYINGPTMRKLISMPAYQNVPFIWIIKSFRYIVHSVLLLHQSSPPIYHKDLKPDNIIVYGSMNEGNLTYYYKIIDFGIAEMNEITTIHGTPGYRPEDDVYTHIMSIKKYYLVDLYALGQILRDMYDALDISNKTRDTDGFIERIVGACQYRYKDLHDTPQRLIEILDTHIQP